MESTEIVGRIKNTFLFEFGKMNERGFRNPSDPAAGWNICVNVKSRDMIQTLHSCFYVFVASEQGRFVQLWLVHKDRLS